MPFTLYKSSAGSGKTYTLVREYLKIALQAPEENFRHVLAITFTNKAAAEMKERIITALKELHLGENPALLGELQQQIPSADVQKNSAVLLRKLLHSYSDFAITTIDSFIYRIVRAFAVQLGIQPDFEVELNAELVLRKIVDRLIAKVGLDSDITKILIEFALSNIDQDRDWDIEEALYSVGREITGPNEKSVSQMEHLTTEDFMRLIGEIKKEISIYQNFMNGHAKEAYGLICDSGLTAADFSYKGEGTVSYLRKLITARKPDELKAGTRFQQGQWYTKNTPPQVIEKIEELRRTGFDALCADMLDYEFRNFRRFSAHYQLLKTIYAIAALREIKEQLEGYKKENRIILISDFNSKVEKLIERQAIPFIYSIAGDRYHHYLIDEFQDTSRAQWQNIYPLVEESLSVGNFNMAVGDSKQAIYRWRGGDWEIIEDKIRELERITPFEESSLQTNFRSLREIVEFNNLFFEHAAGLFAGGDHRQLRRIYEQTQLRQESTHPGGGYVRVEFEEPGETVDESRTIAIGKVRNTIGCLLDEGFSLKDIAILVRSNMEGSEVAEALFQEDQTAHDSAKKGIPIISPDSLLLCREPLINFFISVLTFLSRPSDLISRACMYYYYLLSGLKEEIPRGAIIEEIQRLLDPAAEHRDTTPIGEIVRRRKMLIRQPLYDIMEAVIRLLGLHRPEFSHLAGYLQAFLDTILDFSLKQSGDIELFLQWWEDHKDKVSLSLSEEKDAVRIVTIHKSKGLQFPVVLIPFADWKITLKSGANIWLRPNPPLFEEVQIPFLVNASQGLDDSLFSDGYREEKNRNIIDNLNLLYVAFTRARERLYIFTSGREKKVNAEKAEEITSISRVMRIVIGRMMEGRGLFEWGTPGGKIFRETKPPDAPGYRDIDTFISEPWWRRITIRRKARELWLTAEPAKGAKMQRGSLVHSALARLTTLEEVDRDVENVVQSLVREGLIGPHQKGELKSELVAILEMDEVRSWFDPQWDVKAESTIITARENIRPDRVLISGPRAMVIDYKTGMEDPHHARQLKAYEMALRKMGYSEVKSRILYIDQRKVVHL